ncbi:MAG: porin [Rhodocyclaceae bacterium]
MQKKVIALAVAGLVSGAAFAQSNVTIYGVADAGYVYGSGERAGAVNKNANFSGIQSGLLAGSRIGFRGEEGLGNGLKAVFTLEYNIDIDANQGIGTNGATGLNARQQHIGLSHNKLGTVALGRQYAPAFYALGRNDPFMSSTGIGSLARLSLVGNNTISGTNGARWDNAVTYTSPTWSGFSVRAAYSFAENGQQTTTAGDGVSRGDNGKYGIGGNYANGPLNLDVVYQTRQDANALAVAGPTSFSAIGGTNFAKQDDINEWYVGGSYDFKVVKLFASYQDMNDKNGTSAQEASNDIWQVGATMPVFGNGKIHAGYSRLEWDRTGNDRTIKAWNLMYTHALSKRTTLYTGVTRFDNGDGALAAASNSTVGAAGEKNTTYAAGINHSF